MSKLLGKISHYDRIVAYMTDDESAVELTEHEKQMLTRWMEAFTLQRNYNSTADAAAILQKRFPEISRATAYRDCANALNLFGDHNKATKDGIRHLLKEIIMDAIKIARAKNNEANMMKGAVAIAKVTGINDNDPDLPDFSALEPHTYELGLDNKTLAAIKAMISGGSIDLRSVVDAMATIATDVDYVETKELPANENPSS